MNNDIVSLSGEVVRKSESYEDGAPVYPYTDKTKKMRTMLFIELEGYSKGNEAAGGMKGFGHVSITVDGTNPLATVSAGKRITIGLEQPRSLPVNDAKAIKVFDPNEPMLPRQTAEDAIRDMGGLSGAGCG